MRRLLDIINEHNQVNKKNIMLLVSEVKDYLAERAEELTNSLSKIVDSVYSSLRQKEVVSISEVKLLKELANCLKQGNFEEAGNKLYNYKGDAFVALNSADYAFLETGFSFLFYYSEFLMMEKSKSIHFLGPLFFLLEAEEWHCLSSPEIQKIYSDGYLMKFFYLFSTANYSGSLNTLEELGQNLRMLYSSYPSGEQFENQKRLFCSLADFFISFISKEHLLHNISGRRSVHVSSYADMLSQLLIEMQPYLGRSFDKKISFLRKF